MSSNDENAPSDYQHTIQMLVRDLHMTKNVARPKQFASPNGNNAMHRPHLMTAKPCKNLAIAQSIKVHHLGAKSHHVIIDDDATKCIKEVNEEEEEDTSDTNASPLIDVPITFPKQQQHQRSKRSQSITSDISYNIPSVVVTDVHEPLDLFSSTQRRFSQLYSGLRRLSTSNTVRGFVKHIT